MNDYESVYSDACMYKFVSFDIYDTLIFRAVWMPNDVFKLIEEYINKRYLINSHFQLRRIFAEKIARKKSKLEDISIENIYDYIRIAGIDNHELMDIEKNIEIDVSIPNRDLIEILRALRRDGVKIVITTDMYLDKATIIKILEKNEIEYDYLFISGNIGLTKKSGNLYKYVLDNLGLEASKLMHIGNDSIKDIQNAAKLGIKTIQIEKGEHEVKKYLTQLTGAFMYNSRIKFDNIGQRIGYCCLGPFLAGFCKWVHENNHENEKLWFVSREGYLIKKIYEILYPEDSNKLKYVRLNKNVLRKPLLYYEPTIDNFLASIPEKKTLSAKEITRYLNVPEIQEKKIAQMIDLNKICDIKSERMKLTSIFSIIVGSIKDNIEEQAELLKKYIIQTAGDTAKVVLVNNSIHGNGQRMLVDFISHSGMGIDVIGNQFVMSNKCRNKNIKCKAWLNASTQRIFAFDRNCLIFEHLLFENEGTALEFYVKDGIVEAKCRDQQKEKENYEIINLMQNYAMDFVKYYMQSKFSQYISSNALMEPLLSFLENPNLEDVVEISKIYNDDDLSGSTRILVYDLPMKFSLSHLRNAAWRQGYMKACGFNKLEIFMINYCLYIKSVLDGYYSFKVKS